MCSCLYPETCCRISSTLKVDKLISQHWYLWHLEVMLKFKVSTHEKEPTRSSCQLPICFSCFFILESFWIILGQMYWGLHCEEILNKDRSIHLSFYPCVKTPDLQRWYHGSISSLWFLCSIWEADFHPAWQVCILCTLTVIWRRETRCWYSDNVAVAIEVYIHYKKSHNLFFSPHCLKN